MAQIGGVVKRVAPTDLGVLITGESGVGKEVIVRRIYSESLRCNQPFVKINSAALPDNLIESELGASGGVRRIIQARRARIRPRRERREAYQREK